MEQRVKCNILKERRGKFSCALCQFKKETITKTIQLIKRKKE